MPDTLASEFPDTLEASILRNIAHYFARQVWGNKKPIGIDDCLVAYFKYDWQEMVDRGELPLSKVSDASVRVYPFDVEKRLPIYIGKLVQAGYLVKNGLGYLPGHAVD